MSKRDIDIPPAIENDDSAKPWSPAFFRARIRGALRRQWFMWPARNAVMKRTRVEIKTRKKDGSGDKKNVFYKCEQCGELGKANLSVKQTAELKIWKKSCTVAKKAKVEIPERPNVPLRMAVDHKDPLVPTDGTAIDWQTYVMRLFCSVDNLQVLCEVCHKTKSLNENSERRANVKTNKQSSSSE